MRIRITPPLLLWCREFQFTRSPVWARSSSSQEEMVDSHSFSAVMVSVLNSVYPSLSLLVRIPESYNNGYHHQQSSVHHSSGEHLRLSVGVVGNVVALLLFAAPVLTFKRVIKEKSTGEFSCVPYVAALMNCLIYSWYGSPMVSNNWENLPLFTVNGLGILFECSFVILYLSFAPPRGKKAVYYIVTPVVGGFVAMVVSTSLLKDHHLRKALVGGFGLVASIVMYSSPLVVVKRVIETKSVEFMPFSLSLFSFLSSCLWTAYGILAHDLLIMLPNIIGCPIGIFQIVLYFMYRKRRASTLEIPLKIAMVENVSPSRVDIADGNEPLSNTNVHLQDDEEMVIVEANLEEHIEAPLIINAEEINKSPDIALDIQKIIEEIKERPSGIDVEEMVQNNDEQCLRIDIEKIIEEMNGRPLRVDIEKIEEQLVIDENQLQMGLPLPLVVSVGA